MRHTFETSQWVPYSVATVFAFFANPENLPPLMPRWQKARIEHAFLAEPTREPHPKASEAKLAGTGSVLTITFRALPVLPLRLQWVAVITDFVLGQGFCDSQRSGPLAYWHHCHSIAAEMKNGEAGSLVTDKVTLALPLGPLGDVAYAIVVKRQVASTFRYRQHQLLKLLGSQVIDG